MATEQKTDVPLMRSRKPTLRTVSEHTGFAVATVSRALKGDPKIAKETRRIVAQAAQDIGYVPDRAAQRLRTGRTKVISLLINPSHEFLDFSSVLLRGLVSILKGTGYSVTIIPDFIGEDRVETVRHILQNNLADGIVFTRTEAFDERIRISLEAGMPFVTHGRTEFTTSHAFVDFDNEAYARMAVERLVALGRKRLGIVLPEARFTFAQHLRYGFISTARAAGIAHEILENVTLESEPAELSAQMAKRLKAPDAPDGLVCVGEVSALAALAALDDCGMTLGREVDIVAKRASPVFDLHRPHVDTVFEDIEATGRDMARLLLERIEGRPADELGILHQPVPNFPTR